MDSDANSSNAGSPLFCGRLQKHGDKEVEDTTPRKDHHTRSACSSVGGVALLPQERIGNLPYPAPQSGDAAATATPARPSNMAQAIYGDINDMAPEIDPFVGGADTTRWQPPAAPRPAHAEPLRAQAGSLIYSPTPIPLPRVPSYVLSDEEIKNFRTGSPGDTGDKGKRLPTAPRPAPLTLGRKKVERGTTKAAKKE
ncbi:hypothetical protein Q7P37_002105 [Cladosporium fusiforme]